jgi:hypothetical protein
MSVAQARCLLWHWWSRDRLSALGLPDRIGLAGLRPARGSLHIPGVDQLCVQPGRLQQVEQIRQ